MSVPRIWLLVSGAAMAEGGFYAAQKAQQTLGVSSEPRTLEYGVRDIGKAREQIVLNTFDSPQPNAHPPEGHGDQAPSRGAGAQEFEGVQSAGALSVNIEEHHLLDSFS